MNQYTAVGNATPTYDGRGNLTALGGSGFGYNTENLLTSAPGGLTLSYDPAMRLYQTSAGTTLRFGYDGPDMIGEYSSNALQRRYVFGPGADEPLVWYEGAGTSDRRWLHADERGSITAISDGAGNALAINRYDDYGQPEVANLGRFQYTGQAWLDTAGVYNYKARSYHPRLGRFLQSDPIGYADGMNQYAYVGNDPVNRRDPSGMMSDDPELSGILVIGPPNFRLPDLGLSLSLTSFFPSLPVNGTVKIPGSGKVKFPTLRFG